MKEGKKARNELLRAGNPAKAAGFLKGNGDFLIFFLEKMLDKPLAFYYTSIAPFPMQKCGGIAQLARAFGSYPKCHRFKSSYRYHQCRVSLKYLGAGRNRGW